MNLQQSWYAAKKEQPLWVYLLLPLTVLFWLLSRMRAMLYRCHVLPRYKSKLPVIVVGNISVGGNGKTPVVLALLDYLGRQGIKCAVLSRGYGATQQKFPHLLAIDSEPSAVGDEPALIRRRASVPVVIDPKRARGAKFIEEHTDAQVIICDDGLQHYALDRDIELCVMDKRGIGNGYLMPMGPLRESSQRLNSVNWLIYNGSDINQHAFLHKINVQSAMMSLLPLGWVNVKSGCELSIDDGIEYFKDKADIAAIAGIGDPQRFFDTLSKLGIDVKSLKPLPDHHDIKQADIPSANVVLMTEKDAVKCQSFAQENYWYLQVEASMPDAFLDYIKSAIVSNIHTNR